MKRTISKYGKNFEDIIDIKSDYFEENDRFVQLQKEQTQLYLKQKPRKFCKNCKNQLVKILFTKSDIDYFICENCGHLNGGREDSDEFVEEIYLAEGGTNYAQDYHEDDPNAYFNRVNRIYSPKAKFLLNSLKKLGELPLELSYRDIGAGSGYFVSALKKLGIKDVKGYDTSEIQVAFGNKMNSSQILEVNKTGEIISLVKDLKSQVVSMIGVLEHLQDPSEVVSTISKNKNIEYLFISVPLFSLTVFFEIVFEEVWSRQLSGAHTHLFTEKSLNYLIEKYGLTKVAEWWFGTDFLDLYRDMLVMFEKNNPEHSVREKFSEIMKSVINPLQLILDKNHLSSEVHLLLKKNK